jgi:hypothetical protein
MLAALWQGEPMDALGAVVADGISDCPSQKQTGGDLIAQSAIWLGGNCYIFQRILRRCIERMEAPEIAAVASYSKSLRKSSSVMPSCFRIS